MLSKELNFKASGAIEIQAAPAPGLQAQISIVGYAGGPMKLAGWALPVVIDLRGMSIPAQIPILADHNNTLNATLGHGAPTVSTSTLAVSGMLAKNSPAAAHVIELSRSGLALQASVGGNARETRNVQPSETLNVNGRTIKAAQPFTLVERFDLREISIVAVGADAQTSVAIAAKKGQHKMETETDLGEIELADPVKTERERIGKITALAPKYPNAKTSGEIVAKAVADGWDLNRTELELLRADRPQASAVKAKASSNPDQGKALSAALCLSAGLPEKFVGEQYGEQAMNAATARTMRDYSIQSAIRATLRQAGSMETGDKMNADTIRAALDADRQLRASGFSTVSLSGLLGNVASKTLLNAYNAVSTTWQAFAAVETNKDFKPATRYRLTGKGGFEKIAQDGELKSVGLTEANFANQLDTQGAIIQLTRQMIINDDLGAFTALPKLLGRMAAIAIEEAVYGLLLSNPGNFFSSGNKNLITGGTSVLSIASLTTAEQKFLEQVDDNGKPVMITPKTLLVPPALSVTAAALTRSADISDPSATEVYTTANPHAGRFTPLVSPWLNVAAVAGGSPTAWYLFGDPRDIAAIEVAFLNGQTQPTIEQGEADFDQLGIRWRAYQDFGVAMQDKRAAVKSAGA